MFIKKVYAKDDYKLNFLIDYPENFSESEKYPIIFFFHGMGSARKGIDFLEKNNMQVYNNDQGIINATLNDSILIVDPKFNLMSPFLEKDYDDVILWNGLKNYYNKETIENAIKNPVFLHFVHFINGRPWFKDTKHPCKDLYLKFASDTPYKNKVVVEDYRGLKYKLFFFVKASNTWKNFTFDSFK